MLGNSLASLQLARRVSCGLALMVLTGLVAAGEGSPGATGEQPAVKAARAPQSLLLDVSVTDGLMVAVGERGHILVSRDGGASWTQADVPTRTLLTGVFMHDPQLGWAVGHDEVAFLIGKVCVIVVDGLAAAADNATATTPLTAITVSVIGSRGPLACLKPSEQSPSTTPSTISSY